MVRNSGAGAARSRKIGLCALALICFSGAAMAAPPNVRHVRAGAPAGGNGLTWATAYNDLRSALSTASGSGGAITELWVAQGSYVPGGMAGTDPAVSFTLVPGVAVYGGFAGTEANREQRNPTANVTTLSGAAATVRAYNVVIGAGNSGSILDGFTIRNGRASQAGSAGTGWAGGGIHVTGSPVFRNCIITGNVAVRPDSEDTVFRKGGGVYCAPGSAATFIDCRITGNASGQAFLVKGSAGGGLAAEGCLIRMVRCTIDSNRSGNGGWGDCIGGVMQGGTEGGPGGGLYFGPSAGALLEYCTIRGNTTGTSETPHVCVTPPITASCKDAGDGGGLYAENAFIAAHNCIFAENTTGNGSPGQDGGSNPSNGGNGGDGAGVFATGGSLAFVNCTFVGNQNGQGGIGSEAFPPTSKPAGVDGVAGNGAAAFAGATTRFENCIAWNGGVGEVMGGAEVLYSNVQGGYSGTGNINADPKFIDAAVDDYRLAADSPCIDAANSGADVNPYSPGVQPLPEFDAAGLDRFVNVPTVADTGVGSPVVDMGAFEFQHACAADFTGDGLVDFSDYLEFLNLFDAQDLQADLTGDGLVDFSDYLEFLNLYDAGC